MQVQDVLAEDKPDYGHVNRQQHVIRPAPPAAVSAKRTESILDKAAVPTLDQASRIAQSATMPVEKLSQRVVALPGQHEIGAGIRVEIDRFEIDRSNRCLRARSWDAG